jgi:Zn-dependent peptidase ImmA (M78 family)
MKKKKDQSERRGEIFASKILMSTQFLAMKIKKQHQQNIMLKTLFSHGSLLSTEK